MAEVPKLIPSKLKILRVALLYITRYDAELFLERGPSIKNSAPKSPT